MLQTRVSYMYLFLLFSLISFQVSEGIVLKCTKYENPVFPKIVFESLKAFLHAPVQLYTLTDPG